jgi:lipopolysaccharide/colanic/teichoic acid biosynthesis glycosyltransferase
VVDFEEVVKMDMQYVKTWNIGMDIKILLKTIKVVLTGTGSE